MATVLNLSSKQIEQVRKVYDRGYEKFQDEPALRRESKSTLAAIGFVVKKTGCPLLDATATIMYLTNKGFLPEIKGGTDRGTVH